MGDTLTRPRLLAPPGYGRIVVQYAKVNRFSAHRDVEDTPFHRDLLDALQAAGPMLLEGTHEDTRMWLLGNAVGFEAGSRYYVSGRIGFLGSPGEPPADVYDLETKSWTEATVPLIADGFLAYFLVDCSGHSAAITALAGEASILAVARTLRHFIEIGHGAVEAKRGSILAPPRWSVVAITEPRALETWMENISSLREIEIRYHLPNPSQTKKIKKLIDGMRNMNAEVATATARTGHPEGLRPREDEHFDAALEMVERANGWVVAARGTSSGEKVAFDPSDYLVTSFLTWERVDEEEADAASLTRTLATGIRETLDEPSAG